ncbi:RodZ domain-containing protein [Salinisphaera sp. Q1T1-3]|uniref:RodZ domain-containing protein n=1 Tax=Salinisphaera sp. Q1T1-3 TaxID=2321229 RepID=UPI000E708AC1|nr:RodZ domain-containing protein [Salinisphaera sp. Q1T1-3]RJS92325.1 helix-turn-helix domain-containing protein [Salinisphaera sp. Q1T1-3]
MTAPHDDHIEEDPATTGLSHNKADGVSPGEILREARLAHEYSIDDLCAQTKLSPKTVAALEDNDFQALSQPVFARGYYRQCAKVLDIDLDRMMRAYSAWAGPTAGAHTASPSHVNVIPQDVTPSGSRFGRLFLLLAIVVVAILVALYFVPSNPVTSGASDSNEETTVQTEADTQPDTTGQQSSAAENTPAESGADDGIAGGNTPDVVGSGNNQPRTGQTTGGRNVNQTLGIQPPGGDNSSGPDENGGNTQQTTPSVPPNRLVLNFNKRSWVRVTDANGNRLASGIFESGQTQTFNGEPPYEVRLGFAPGVKVTIGGQPVDVASQTNGSSVATLSVAAPSGAAGDSSND